MIPVADPRRWVIEHREELEAAFGRVLASGVYILGPEVETFEHDFAASIGMRNGVGVSSGTDALVLALRGLGIGSGDEVVTVSHTAVSTVAAIEATGAKPVLVDVDPQLYTMDVDALSAAVTPRTKAVVPVHLYGQPAPMDEILDVARRHGLAVVEDCAQAHGARLKGRSVGSFGVASCFSFYPTKNLGGLGDGGLVATDDLQLADRVRQLRQLGWRERYVSFVPSLHARLDELQAALLRVRLESLPDELMTRRRVAASYTAILRDGAIVSPAVRTDGVHAWHLYVVRTSRRDALRDFLKDAGINSAIHYPMPVHRQPAYRHYARHLPVTDALAGEILSLPMFGGLRDEEVRQVGEACRRFNAGVGTVRR